MIKKGWLVIYPTLCLLGVGMTPITLANPSPQPLVVSQNTTTNAAPDQDQNDNDEYENIEDFGQDQDEGQNLPLNPNQEAAPVQAVPPGTPQQNIPPPPQNTTPHPGDEGDDNQ